MFTRNVKCHECGYDGKMVAHDTIRQYPEESLFKHLGKDLEGYIHLQCPKCSADLTIDPFSALGTRKLTDVSKKRFGCLGAIVILILLVVTIGYFFYGKNSQEPTFDKSPSISAHAVWWMSEFPALINVVSAADNATLSTSYRTGPGGKSQVKLSLLKEPSGSLILKVELPKEAISSIDPKTGEKIPSKVSTVIIIRDHNLDGIPDDYIVEPSGEPLYEEEFTKDGFIKFRNSPDHQIILVQWIVGIGFSVNHFLHNVDSAMPR